MHYLLYVDCRGCFVYLLIFVDKTSVWIAGGWGLNCFLNPPNTLSNYVLGRGSAIYCIHKIYITVLFGLWPSKSSLPPANFSQFKHWIKLPCVLNKIPYLIDCNLKKDYSLPTILKTFKLQPTISGVFLRHSFVWFLRVVQNLWK